MAVTNVRPLQMVHTRGVDGPTHILLDHWSVPCFMNSRGLQEDAIQVRSKLMNHDPSRHKLGQQIQRGKGAHTCGLDSL